MKLRVMLKMLIVSYIITGVCLLLLALLLYRFRLPGGFVSAGVTITYVLSTFLTGFLAGKGIGTQKFLWGLCLGASYFVVLLMVSLILHKSGDVFGASMLISLFLCLASGMLGGMLA